MSYPVREHGHAAVVELSGEVDMSCSPEARKAILSSLEAGRDTAVDLSQVEYIDSSGIASLVEGYQTARKLGRRFALVGVGDAVRGVLELARLDQVFPIHHSADEWLRGDG